MSELADSLVLTRGRKEGRICISVVQLAAECLRTLKCVDPKKGWRDIPHEIERDIYIVLSLVLV